MPIATLFPTHALVDPLMAILAISVTTLSNYSNHALTKPFDDLFSSSSFG